ncbi:SET domain-containing protein [Kribbella sp. DT2]|uniref:SET domain-containing protein n=1 Tax=Kribbella sp. DT2 TaxID=3393427 RepID=UPI003CEA4E38
MLIESDPGYTQRITGSAPRAGDAQSLLTMRPPALANEAKVVLGVFEGATGTGTGTGAGTTSDAAGTALPADGATAHPTATGTAASGTTTGTTADPTDTGTTADPTDTGTTADPADPTDTGPAVPAVPAATARGTADPTAAADTGIATTTTTAAADSGAGADHGERGGRGGAPERQHAGERALGSLGSLGSAGGADDRARFADGGLVAVVDLLRGYPEQSVAYIGLLQVHGGRHGRGIGRAAYRLVEQYVVEHWPEVRRLRLAVVDTNAESAAPFWIRQGFEPTGEAKAYENEAVRSMARLYEKALCWAHPHLVVRESSIAGQGLFATAPIAAGEVVSVLAGRKVSTAELTGLLKHPPVDTITLEDDLHLVLPNDPRPVIAYGNHSCDANTWWTDAVTLTARRDFAPGDELTSDYGTSTGVDNWQMTCTCGSLLCRKVITGADWQLPELQERYGNHWIPELLARQTR